MDRKANPRLYDEIQDTESLSVVSTFSYRRAIALAKGIRILEFRNSGNLWNPESWALESGKQLKESGIQVSLTTNPDPRRGIKNPRLPWIALHEAK